MPPQTIASQAGQGLGADWRCGELSNGNQRADSGARFAVIMTGFVITETSVRPGPLAT
jgi:hypothetical protein